MYVVKRHLKAFNYSKVIFETECKEKALEFINRKQNMWSWYSCATFVRKYSEVPQYRLWRG